MREESAIKTRESRKHVAGDILPAAPPSPGELAKVSPGELAGAEPEESPDAVKNKAKLRGFAVLFAALAALYLLLGEEWYAMLMAACALGNALEGETRWRVPKLVKVCVTALVVVLSIYTFVLMILKAGGR
jgi:hypothetical protein